MKSQLLNIENDSGLTLIVGHLETDINGTNIGLFKEVHSEKDLNFLSSLKIRSRFNSQREFRLFYFRSDQFKMLNESLEKDHDKFVNFLTKVDGIKYMKL